MYNMNRGRENKFSGENRLTNYNQQNQQMGRTRAPRIEQTHDFFVVDVEKQRQNNQLMLFQQVLQWKKEADAAYDQKKYYEAFLLYQKAADVGDPIAAHNVSHLIFTFHKHIPEKNLKKILDHYLAIAVKAEIPHSLHDQGSMHYYGIWGYEKNLTAALPFFQKAASRKYIPSVFFTALYLIHSERKEEQFQGFQILNRLVFENNFLDALVDLGNCFYYGIGTQVDQKRAFELFTRAKEQGKNEAALIVAGCYLEGTGIEKNIEQGMQLLQKIASEGNCKALIFLARIYEEGLYNQAIDNIKYFECITRAVVLGDITAKYKLAISYLYGIGVNADPKFGYIILEQMAKEDYVDAIYMMGFCHYEGLGTPNNIKNEKLAFEFFKRSAEKNLDVGIKDLALSYKNGIGVEPDYKKAFELIVQLNNKDTLEAKALLATFYMDGIGVLKNYDKAAKLFQEILEHPEGQNHPNVFLRMSVLYLNGWGVSKDVKKSNEILNQLMTHEYLPAYIVLAERYREGQGVAKDARRCFQYLFGALQLNEKNPSDNFTYQKLQTLVGDCFYMGFGTDKDIARANSYYEKGIALNRPEAFDTLGLCSLMGWDLVVPVSKDLKNVDELQKVEKQAMRNFLPLKDSRTFGSSEMEQARNVKQLEQVQQSDQNRDQVSKVKKTFSLNVNAKAWG